MKLILTIILCLFLLPVTGQPSTEIRGVVTDQQGFGIPGVNIRVKNSGNGTTTNHDGSFMLQIDQQKATLVFSFVGYKTKEVEVKAGKPDLEVALEEKLSTLEEIEIYGRKETSYKSNYTYAATKTATPISEIPKAITSVTKEMIEDQQAFELPDVVKNMAGVSQNTMWNDLVVRGFRHSASESFRLVNGLRSGMGFFNNPLLVNMERVEVIKGPGSALYGNYNPGGTINMVTKKPLLEERKAINFAVGSFNTIRSTLDFTGPLNEEKTLLYRLNAGYEDTETFRDFSNRTSFMLAPSVTFIPTDKTTLSAELVYSTFDGYLDRGVAIPGQDLDAADITLSLSQPSDYYQVKDIYFISSLHHAFSENFSFNLSWMKYFWDESLAEHRTANNWIDNGNQTISNLRYWERIDQRQNDNISAYFVLKGLTGSISHQLLAGLDYIYYDTNGGTVWEAREKKTEQQEQVINLAGDTINVTRIAKEPLQFDLNNPLYRHRGNDISNYVFRRNRDIGDRATRYNTTGIYLQDQISFPFGLKVLAGMRYEMYRDQINSSLAPGDPAQPQNIFVPRLGLVYPLLKNLNLYANFSEGFIPLDPIYIRNPSQFRPDGSDQPYEHQQSNLVEFGGKSTFWQGQAIFSLSFYQIRQQNILQNTGQINNQGNDIIEQVGEIDSKGVELEMVGNPLPNLSLNVNYAYNRTEILETDDETQLGLTQVGAPEHLFSFWAKYMLGNGALEGLGIALGSNYVSDRRHRFLTTDLDTGIDDFDVWPSYLILDAAVYYQIDKIRISMNVDNLLNTRHWIGGYDYLRANPGTPRNYLLSLGYRF